MVAVIGIAGYLYAIKRVPDEISEKTLAVSFRPSPNLKILKVIAVAVASSFTFAVFMISLISLTITSAHFIESLMIPLSFNWIPPINAESIAVKTAQGIDTSMIACSDCILIIQIYTPTTITVDNKSLTLLPLIIYCNVSEMHSIKDSPAISFLCRTYNDENALLDAKTVGGNTKSGTLHLCGASLNYTATDLRELSTVELIPGLTILHSAGSIGSQNILADPNKVFVLPGSQRLLETITSCVTLRGRMIAIFINNSEQHPVNHLCSKLGGCDYVATVNGSTVTVYSNTIIPTLDTIGRIVLLVLISTIIAIASSGGLVERLSKTLNTFVIQGIPPASLSPLVIIGWSAVSTACYLTLAYTSTIILNDSFGKFVLPILSSLISIFATGVYLSKRAVSSFRLSSVKLSRREFVTVAILEPSMYTNFVQCINNYIVHDDFFTISEVEVLDASLNERVIHIQMNSKIWLNIEISVDVLLKRVDESMYEIAVGVSSNPWEEIPQQIIEMAEELALSKIAGSVKLCIQS